ncbi:Tim44/TimA family putative adaptor protein [Asticcacaulis tiandongensis]|uniref:Tim44/TimA family putative adaptor protein n=1 Tax=Asticcacaulis tiandongensis TaxID=2565365 RepID=UPI00112789DB|nr:Tim44/TimA family putative adaptor protein [Asticcacaulis tiandongensis]
MSWDLVILAVITVVVLFQLYNVLGKRVGLKAEDKAGAKKPEENEGAVRIERAPETVRIPNLEVLKTRDANFNEINFLEKAREVYEQIVLAFNRGEVNSVKERLSDTVYKVFSDAAAARSDDAKKQVVKFVDTPKADIDTIDFKDDLAQVRVRFLSELVYETRTPSDEVGKPDAVSSVHRRTAEYWTFQKTLKTPNHPWMLIKVEAAKA